MAKKIKVSPGVSDETDELKNRLRETEETLFAIRQYLVDAFVVNRADGMQVVTLKEADFPYRRMVEAMNEGAVTLIPDGTIFYCNPHFCQMIQMRSEQIIGIHFQDLIVPAEQEAFDAILKETGHRGTRREFCLRAANEKCVPVQLSVYELAMDGTRGLSLIATNLTERVEAEKKIRSLASALTRAEQEERHRISQILHDDLQQRLFAIKAQLSIITYDKEDDVPPDILSVLQQIQNELSNAVSITRNLSIGLSPVVLHGEGLAEAIAWLSSQMKEQFGLQVKIEAKANLNPLEDHIRVLLFRAVRELLFNIVKHAGTLQAAVKLEEVKGHIRITVSDTGAGFDVESILNNPQSAHGLLIIQNRLNLMDGVMEITSKMGEGTRVVIETPLELNST